jgi:hypothetical protein
MDGAVLNLPALRTNRLFEPREADLNLEQVADAPESFSLTRRQALKLAGLAVGTAVGLKAGEKILTGPFELVQNKNRLAFKLGGKERWVIDTRHFTGSPLIEVTKTENLIRFELKNAKYPGTDIPADLVCELKQGMVDWWMKLSLAFGGFMSEVPFEKWLADMEPLRSKVKMAAPLCILGGQTAVMMSGSAKAEYSPDWTLRLNGSKAAKITGLGPDLVSDSVTIASLDPKDSSIISKPAAKRTLITVKRGEHDWPIKLSPEVVDGWKLAATGSTFDIISIEAGQGRTGYVSRALLAESAGLEANLYFQTVDGLAGHQGQPFRLPLRKARYAAAFEPSGIHTAIIADYDKNPVWLHSDGYSLQLGDASGVEPFELVATNGKIMKGYSAPALLGMTAPLPDAVVETTRFPEGTKLNLLAITATPITILKPKLTDTIKPNLVDITKPSTLPNLVSLPNSFTVSVVRPEDLLVLSFEFVNLGIQGTNLVPTKTTESSYIIVHFQPQSITEQAFYENAGLSQPTTDPEKSRNEANPGAVENPTSPPVKSRISGPSRLAFLVPKEITQIPYNLKSLLDWTKYRPSVAATAKPPDEPLKLANPEIVDRLKIPTLLVPLIKSQETRVQSMALVSPSLININRSVYTALPVLNIDKTAIVQPVAAVSLAEMEAMFILDTINKPLSIQTAIEMPYRLILSPHVSSGWKHSLVPVNHNNIKEPVELWHTRLGVKDDKGNIDEKNEQMRTLRAIWSPDYVKPPSGAIMASPSGHVNSPFRMSLDSRDRHEIVRLTADYHIGKYKPLPIEAEQFMLTALGAWMRSQGAWNPPDATELEVEAWQHRATMARDHYVRVVYRGYLFPFGHRASLIKVTERKFQKSPGLLGSRTAYLRQRMYIVVREPEKAYTKSETKRGRQFPFRRILLKTAMTPSIDNPTSSQIGSYGQQGFWPCINSSPFQFHLFAEDLEGRMLEFSAPLIFVGKEYATNSNKKLDMDKINNSYIASGARRQVNMNGQKIAYAASAKKDDTTVETANITLKGEIPAESETISSGQPRFYPVMEKAAVRMPEVAMLSGSDTGTVEIKLPETFLNSGFDSGANKGGIFAEILGTKPSVNFKGDKAGAIAKPNMSISGISRAFGPVGGALENMMGGSGGSEPSFNPSDFFSDAASLFGGFKLTDILPSIPLGDVLNDALNLSKIPGLTVKYDYDPTDVLLQFPIAVNIIYDWKPEVKECDLGIVKFLPKDTKDTLALNAKLKKNLKNLSEDPSFELVTDVKNFSIDFVDVIGVEFNKLNFTCKNGQKPDVKVDIKDVQFKGCLEIVNELRNFLKSDGTGPYIDISAEGVEAGISVALPSIAVGMFSLQNMTLSSRLVIPFTDNPVTMYFAFCTRENPFLLSVGPFGGGGFFQIAINLNGVQLIEASFEFGATCSFGIAGLASGKVYVMGGIYFNWQPSGMQFTAYFKMGGSLRILGIITVSVEFYMELTYLTKGHPDGSSTNALLRGRATLTVEIEILFFSISVELSVEREFSVGDPTFTQQVKKNHWLEYCEAFV